VVGEEERIAVAGVGEEERIAAVPAAAVLSIAAAPKAVLPVELRIPNKTLRHHLVASRNQNKFLP